MELILPYNTKNREHFCNCAMKVGFHEFVALKVLYTMKDSDLDVFQLMARERLDLVLYGWELCQVYWDEIKNKNVIPSHLHTVLKQLTQYSLDIWFSNEWEDCKPRFKAMLLICLKRACNLLVKLADSEVFDWGYTLRLGIKPWDIPYLREFVTCNSNLSKKFTQSSEHVETPATNEDIEHLRKEGLVLLLLRLIKLFDAGFLEGVRRLSMRIIAAWNHEYEQRKLQTKVSYPEVNRQHKQCLILICHIYLMAIYEMDDIRGFVIDNLLTNIRFYYQNMVEEPIVKTNPEEQLEYTPARYIVITCINLQISSNEFIDAFIYDSYDENFVSLFGVISQSYLSYLLGNLLMEMNKLNEDDFNKHIENFKRIIHLYIKERERSELFMMGELHKKEMRRHSHSRSATKENMTNFYNKMCKGNRLSNIGSTEHTEDDEQKYATTEEENERRVDPIFQHLPNNQEVLNYVYTVLVKRTHRGWYFAKLIVLLKIIGFQLNAIETWRYHPGLTPEFLLNLEVKLSRHFEDLAIIFQEHLFMEQEFWLTGFYLNPCKKYYETVIRSGMRSNRLSHRFETGENYDDDDRYDNRRDRRDRRERGDKPEKVNAISAKYGLLSSTIDVKEIVKLANHEAPDSDYGQLYKALHSFKLPDNIIKDLLTIIFLPRNKSFAWALNWVELRKRCKSLLKDNELKRRFVELNMAEANDRLTFLKVDYDKYKHRPQLDYGSIEQGYESTNMQNFNKDSSDENEDEDSEDFEADSDLDEPAKHEPKKNDHAQLFDSYFMSTRRTRARAAAMIANVMERDVSEMRDEKEEVSKMEVTEDSKKEECVEKVAVTTPTKDTKRDFNDILKERKVFDNSTSGFNPFPDIWSVDAQELKAIEEKLPHLETGNLFEKSNKLDMLKLKNAALLNQQSLKYKIVQEAIMKSEREEAEELERKKLDEEIHLEVQKVSQPAEIDKAKNDSVTDLEMHDDESDVSTTARRDSDEVNDLSKDEQLDQGDAILLGRFAVEENEAESAKETKEQSTANTEASLSKPPRVKIERNDDENEKETGTNRNENNTERETRENGKKVGPIKNEKETEMETNENESEKEKETNENVTETETTANELSGNKSSVAQREDLLKLFTQKKLCVRLRKLRVADVQKLRQPSVRLQRMELNGVSNRLGTLRPAERKFYTDFDESSKSSNSSLSNEPTNLDTMKRSFCYSESSTESEEYKKRRRVGRPTRGRSSQGSIVSAAPTRMQEEQSKSLKVTPRSASGLKFRISTNQKSKRGGGASTSTATCGVNSKANNLPIIDYIQISSSSSSDEGEQFVRLNSVQEVEDMDVAIDPLYEEEIPIFRIDLK